MSTETVRPAGTLEDNERVALSGPAMGLRRLEDVRWQRPIVYPALLILCLAWTWHAGRDLNWDLLNYHVYAGFSVVHDRFGQDFFAAFPAYYTPYAHTLFYGLLVSGLSAPAMAAALVTVHCVLLWLVHELALRVSAGHSRRIAGGVAVFAALFAFANPLFLQVLGTSFIDATTSLPVLACWVLLFGVDAQGRGRAALFGGLLMGVATALKLSNAIFVIATIPAVLMLAGNWRAGVSRTLVYGIASGVGFLLVAGPWALRLWHEFGNPFFPMFNDLFRSPDFPSDLQGTTLERFLPGSVWDAMILPVRMLLPVSMIQAETASPDLRYAALLTLVVLWAARVAWRGLSPSRGAIGSVLRRGGVRRGEIRRGEIRATPLMALGVVFLVSWCLWLLTSGNGRYFLPGASIAGILVCGTLAAWLGRTRGRVMVLWLAVLLSLQAAQIALGAAPRFISAPWSARWLEIRVPERYRQNAYFHLVLGPLSTAFLAPFVHPDSGFFNLSGGFEFDPDGPGSARVDRLLKASEGRVRMSTLMQTKTPDGRYRMPGLASLDNRLLPWGLRIDASDCDSIGLDSGLSGLIVTGVDEGVRTFPDAILSCAVVPAAPADRLRHDAERRRIEPVFDHLEQACPNLFKPRGLRAVGGDGRWTKGYGATDTTVSISGERIHYVSAMRDPNGVVVGSVADWIDAPGRLDCEGASTSSPNGASP